MLRAYPRLVGDVDAVVEAEMTPQSCVFLVTPPPSRTVVSRAVSALRDLLPASEDATAFHEVLDTAFEERTTFDQARQIGERLAAAASLDAVLDEVAVAMRDRFCCEEVGLWRIGPAGMDLVGRRGLARTAAKSCRSLMLGEREVGRLEVDMPTLDEPHRIPLLEAILPWLAVALARFEAMAPRPSVVEETVARLGLTGRQQEVALLLCRGMANKEIAAALGISPRTVEIHLSQVFRKAGVDSRVGLMARLAR